MGDFSVSVSVLTGQVARRLTLFDSGVKDSAIVIMNAVIANCGPACGASGDTESGPVDFELPATLLGMNDLDYEYFLLDLEEGDSPQEVTGRVRIESLENPDKYGSAVFRGDLAGDVVTGQITVLAGSNATVTENVTLTAGPDGVAMTGWSDVEIALFPGTVEESSS